MRQRLIVTMSTPACRKGEASVCLLLRAWKKHVNDRAPRPCSGLVQPVIIPSSMRIASRTVLRSRNTCAARPHCAASPRPSGTLRSGTEHCGSGAYATSSSRARFKSSTSGTPSRLCGTSPRNCTGTRRDSSHLRPVVCRPCWRPCALPAATRRRRSVPSTSNTIAHGCAMRTYAGLCEGSDTSESGCKSILRARSKTSGMHWTVYTPRYALR